MGPHGRRSPQGGPLTAAEAAAFEQDPLFAEKCQLRRWDEAAKEIHVEGLPNLAYYEAIMVRHLAQPHQQPQAAVHAV